ncbi:MAG: T9SS type A sorting domain-containing protein [Bacteroidota bacterium]
MNNIKLLFSAFFMGIFLSFHATGQLAGIKTIGGDDPDYATFESAISALNAQGVASDGVRFLVRSGVYNENPNLSITNVNTDGTGFVIFQPDEGAEVEVNFEIPDFSWGFRIENSKNITFTGTPFNSTDHDLKAMTVNGNRINEDDQFFTVYISNGSESSGFSSMVITHEDNQDRIGFSLPVYISTYQVTTPPVGMRNLFVRDCLIVGGNTYGVFLDGDPDKKVVNSSIVGNEIRDFARFGVLLQSDVDSTLIDGNEIYQTYMGRSAVYGMSIGGDNHYTTISNNYIHSLISTELAGLRGIQMNTGTTNNLIYNNAIYIVPAETNNVSYGLYILGGDNANNKVYHNSIYMGGVTTRDVSSYALRVSKDVSNDVLVNNILVNERTGGTANHYALAMKAITFAHSDHNFLSVMSDEPGDNRYVARIGTGSASVELNTLADLLNAPDYAPRDQNSLTGDPQWTLPLLEILPESPAIESGIPVDFIATDILGNPRDLNNPDMGAYEYQPPLPCLPPAELFADNVSSNSASLDWSEQGNEDQWDLLWGPDDFDPDTEGNLIEGITDKPFLVEGLTPQTAYKFYVRSVCGEEVTVWSEPGYFTTPVLSFVISASAGENGNIDPAGEVTVEAGNDQLFTFIHGQGFQVDDVLVDGESLGAMDSYLFENVQQDHTIHVVFGPAVLTLTASAGENGTIEPAGEVPVLYGQSQLFTMFPDEGYMVADVLVDDESVGAVSEWFFENVTTDHTIHVTFQEETFTLTFKVEDQQGQDITDATITLGDVSGEPGQYIFTGLLAGEYNYSVERQGYFDANASVSIIDADVEETVVLEPDGTFVNDLSGALLVYPNPANEGVWISSEWEISTLYLFDLKGNVIAQAKPVSDKGYLATADIPEGFYFLKITTTGGDTWFRQIVIAR